MSNVKVGGSLAAIVMIGIAVMTVLFGCWYTIDARERGVILRNGKVIGTASPGLGFKWPLIDSVVEISMETLILQYKNLHSYSRDQQPANIGLSVNFRVVESQVDEVYESFGSVQSVVDRIISPKVHEELKTVFGRYNAVTAIQERGRLNADIRAAIIAAIKGPIVIENVQIENIDFSKAYEQSIEQRMLAEVEVQRIRQNAEREKVQAEILVIQAKAKADAVRAEAEAQADAIRFRGDAEAQAIRARGAALGDNPQLVSLVQAERWNGVLPVTMIPNGSVPMLSVGK